MPLNGQVLVLNQNYEPLMISRVKKAIILIYLGKAEIIDQWDGKMIQGVRAAFPYPSIIRLSTPVHRPWQIINLSRKNIMKRDGYQCQYCGTRTQPLTVDHIIPKMRGGKDTWDNLITACIHCNNKKGHRTLQEAQMTLRKQPRRPHPLCFIQTHTGGMAERWKPYLFMS